MTSCITYLQSHPLRTVNLGFISCDLTLKADLEMILPRYTGSALRGMFLNAYHRYRCSASGRSAAGKAENCPNCADFTNPSNPGSLSWYTGEKISPPFIITPPPLRYPHSGKQDDIDQTFKNISFTLTLLGGFGNHILEYLMILNKAGELGLGKKRKSGFGQFRVIDLKSNRIGLIHEEHDKRLSSSDVMEDWKKVFGSGIKKIELELTTPLQIKSDHGKLDAESFRLSDLIRSLLWRFIPLFHFYGDERYPFEEMTERFRELDQLYRVEKNIVYTVAVRKRHTQNIDLSGLLGKITVEGDLDVLMPYLWLGQYLHAGKHVSHGLGAYRIIYR